MPLPAIIRAEFEYVNPETTQESDYYGAYNILLGHAFPVADGYVVHPQVAPADFRRDALDFVVYFRIDLHRIPVFFVEIKTAVAIKNLCARTDADDQMRLRLRQLFDQSLTELHGISALGTRLCFYCLDKNTESVTPLPIALNTAYVNDTAPVDRWDTDILTDDGYNRFMNIVGRVRALAAVEAKPISSGAIQSEGIFNV